MGLPNLGTVQDALQSIRLTRCQASVGIVALVITANILFQDPNADGMLGAIVGGVQTTNLEAQVLLDQRAIRRSGSRGRIRYRLQRRR